MKFRKLSQGLLAAVASAGVVFGVSSCANDHTVGYVYVTGTQYNQIGEYKEDNNNGILKPVAGSPIGSGGTNPLRAIIPSGGRFMYVLNAGARKVDPTTHEVSYTGSNISVFSIGGYGQLAFQSSYSTQGIGPIRIAADSTGSHLYVLDQYAPIGNAGGTISTVSSTLSSSFPCQESAGVYRPVGDITVLGIDSNTGRLSVVSNQQQQGLTYFPIGCSPVDFHVTSSNIFSMDAGSTTNSDVETVFVYALNSSSGQLTQTQNAPLQTGAVAVSNIAADSNSSHIYLIDPGSNAASGGTIFPFTIGTGGALTAANGGATVNTSSAAGNPQQLITVTGSSNTFAYVANAGPAPGTNVSTSDISGYILNTSTGHFDSATQLSPYGNGIPSGVVCIFEDPSNQFIYAAGSADNTIAGRKLDPATGSLKQLNKATAFSTVGTPSWCLATPNNQ